MFIMKANAIFSILVAGAFVCSSCNNEASKEETKADTTITKSVDLKEENVTYSANGINMKGYVAYDAAKEGVRPAILVVHEWWGLNDYAKRRAKQLAELGYIAM